MENLGAIVLAAGRGKRLNSKGKNKVLLKILGIPMIDHTVELLNKLGIKDKVVVVGFAKKSIVDHLGKKVKYAIQKKQEGTADAVKSGIEELSKETTQTLVMYGDHSFFYTTDIVKSLINFKDKNKYSAVIVTVNRKDPFNYGRIIRDKKGNIVKIVEEKNADDKQKKIQEINPGFYLFDISFLRKFLPKIVRNPISMEYYLTDIIEVSAKNGVEVGGLKINDEIISVGVNTKEQLKEAEDLMLKRRNDSN